jgi:RNA polymerase sigma-70 factor (ECF subfamily)
MPIRRPESNEGPSPPVGRADRSASDFIGGLYAAHGRALLAYIQGLGAGHHDAEEVVQETMVRAWRNADVLDPATGSIRGWLCTVARHILIDRMRVRIAIPMGASPAGAESVTGDHQEAVVERIIVLNALARLSAEQREAVVEVYYRGRTFESIARSLGIPAGTIRSRAYYGLRRLRNILFESGDFGED